ncbi:hypothetical protein [Mycolicibacterium mageritense]|nr:hypothetical protein [Mycolicibacterium mageritense]
MFEDNASWELALCIGESVADEAMMMAWRMSMIGELLNRHIAEVEAEDDDPGFVLVTGFCPHGRRGGGGDAFVAVGGVAGRVVDQ